jgi:2-polyprenyl-6-methoxyphenol hydroxylase-like FAD-dependent oxidoreductase
LEICPYISSGLNVGLQEGEQLVEEILQAVAQFGVDDPKAAAANLEVLRTELRAKNNSYVTQVLDSFAAL